MRFPVLANRWTKSSKFQLFNRQRRTRKKLLWLAQVFFILGVAALSMHGITLVWDANTNSNVAGYVLYSGTNRGAYYARSFLGNVTSNRLSGLLRGVNYFFAITTRTLSGMESDFSNETLVRLPLSNHPPTITAISDVSIGLGGATDPIPFRIGDSEIPAANLYLTASCSNPNLVLSSGIKFSGTGSNRFVTVTPDATKMGSASISIFVSNGSSVATNVFTLNVGSGTPVASDFWLTSGGLKLIWSSHPWSLFRVFYKTNLSDLCWTQASMDLVSVGTTTSWTDATVKQSAARFYKVLQID
jgi:hypothetical protein